MLTGKPKATFRGITHSVKHLAFSGDGKSLAAGGSYRDSVVTVWDVATSQEIASYMRSYDAILSIAFSPDCKTLAVGYEKKSIRLWDVPARK